MAGFMVGALIGAGVALLLAPASGEETRRRLGTAARRASRDARDKVGELSRVASDTVRDLKGDAKAAIEAGRDAFRHDRTPVDPRDGAWSEPQPSTLRTP